MPPPVLAALVAAMALTGATVAFGKGIAATIRVQVLMLFRLAVATLARAPMIRSEPGPQLALATNLAARVLAMPLAVLDVPNFDPHRSTNGRERVDSARWPHLVGRAPIAFRG